MIGRALPAHEAGLGAPRDAGDGGRHQKHQKHLDRLAKQKCECLVHQNHTAAMRSSTMSALNTSMR